ncbi:MULTISPECIES: hypothetical protein [unclassified Micromonospora]|uniref:hypothetical protein n=1 Tax=unclassified Micromonospora TaxID=2617518 RepID=UPI001B376C73|nr:MULTISPECIES: hypothetical protein [unclassified Micromonospora]MBQ1045498.1 hypothetical protein [Micromonospora sp. C72]MBQ1055354.1 hypothetical protein [Micromonospora sp. C32]
MRETLGAALRRQRIGVAVAVVVGWLAAVVDMRAEEAGGPLVLVSLVPLAVLLVAAVRELRRRPSRANLRMDEHERAFFAPPRATVGFLTVLTGFVLYRAIVSGDGAVEGSWDWGLAAFFLPFAIVFTALGWFRVPVVELTPEGITHGRHERRWFVPWAALDPQGQVGWRPGNRTISLPVARPDLIRAGRGVGRDGTTMAVREVDVAPALVAGAIRHYLTHSEHRAAIGTGAEYARLVRALAGEG